MKFAAYIALFSAALALSLLVMRQPLWCAAGDPWPWSIGIGSAHNSQHLVDAYSLSHLLHGIVFGRIFALLGLPVFWSFLGMLALESGWEILENSPLIIERYRSVTISLGYSGDSIANSLSDLWCCSAGFWLTQRVSRWTAWSIFAVIELGSAWAFKDGLLLNVLMLIYPIDAVRAWQLG